MDQSTIDWWLFCIGACLITAAPYVYFAAMWWWAKMNDAESLVEWNVMRMRKAARSLNLLPDTAIFDQANVALATRLIDAWTNIDRNWPWPVPPAHYEIALSALIDTAPVVKK
jgi:hypothetical protein